MAKQAGIIKIKGTLDDLTFYKRGDAYILRERGGIEKGRIATDPAFQRTRENMAEFTNVASSAKLFRETFRSLFMNGADSASGNRLTSQLFQVLKSDTTSLRGQRTVAAGDLTLMKGYEFNALSSLRSVLYATVSSSIDRTTGEVEVTVPAIVPADVIVAPLGATHYKFVSVAAEMDFAADTFNQDMQSTALNPLDSNAVLATTLTHELTPNSTSPMFIVVAIQFSQEVNGVNYPLKNGAGNAITLLNVDVQ